MYRQVLLFQTRISASKPIPLAARQTPHPLLTTNAPNINKNGKYTHISGTSNTGVPSRAMKCT
jgi:hypothetical protein